MPRHLILLAVTIGLGLLGCGSESGPSDPAVEPEPPALELLSVRSAEILLPGSLLVADTRGLTAESATLRITAAEASTTLEQVAAAGVARSFALSPEAAALLASSTGTPVQLVLGQGAASSAAMEWTPTVQNSLPVSLSEAPAGAVHREDSLLIRGDGLLSGTEGATVALVEGHFQSEPTVTQTATLPVTLTEAFDRTRAAVRLTTDLGGLQTGPFTGTLRLQTTTLAGIVSTSQPAGFVINIGPPEVYSVGSGAALGQLLTIDGAGLLGQPDRPDEVTVLRFDGTVTDADGDATALVGEQVLQSALGSSAQLPVTFETVGSTLESTFFGVDVGRFDGSITPVVVRGANASVGPSLPVSIALRGVHQMVVVSFLPGFRESLHRFGLALAAEAIEAAVLARMANIYAPWAVTFVRDTPDDFLPAAVARLELGGSDPTGFGVFGYDNTPGKDLWNLRLSDQIGGANAEVQADGQPGYGGVFIDSLLWWSTHPELAGPKPEAAPEPDPLFDEIFDPVRNQPATLAEVAGTGEPDRVAAVQRAIDALGSIAGETAAHEFGHSLGLAEPWAGPMVFHRYTPGDGCLMDAGSERPFGERAAQTGFAQTTFCGNAVDYLDEILPRPID